MQQLTLSHYKRISIMYRAGRQAGLRGQPANPFSMSHDLYAEGYHVGQLWRFSLMGAGTILGVAAMTLFALLVTI